jgi:hypothetical protein
MNRKSLLLSVLGVMLLTSVASAAGKMGLQFSANSPTLGLIYYTDDYKWAMGGNLGYGVDNAASKTDLTKLSFFVRNNTALTDNSYIGYGVSAGFAFGQVAGSTIVNSYNIAPYVAYDVALNKSFSVVAGVYPVKYDYTESAVFSAASTKTTTWTYLSTFASVTYLF